MYIIVKFIDAVVVLAILLLITLSILNRDSYSSMLNTAPNGDNVEEVDTSLDNAPIDNANTTDTEDVIISEQQ